MSNCAECGTALRLSKGAGRKTAYRGAIGYEIPASLEYEVCDNCGAEWMTDAQLDVLSDALEEQRQARIARSAAAESQRGSSRDLYAGAVRCDLTSGAYHFVRALGSLSAEDLVVGDRSLLEARRNVRPLVVRSSSATPSTSRPCFRDLDAETLEGC